MDSVVIVLLVGLLICCWKDIRFHMVSLPFVLIWTCILGVMQIYHSNAGMTLLVVSVITGAVACLTSYLTGGAIGMGDGFMFAMAVMGLGVMQGLCMLIYCFAGAFAAALVLVVFFRKGRDSRLPLAPFVLLGSLLAVLV